MRNIKAVFILAAALLQLNYAPLHAKEKNKFIDDVKSYVESNGQLSKELKSITIEFGSPMWNQTLSETFQETKIAITPTIDYKNDFVSGIIIFIEGLDSTLKYHFISREELFKHYVNKKKSQKLLYRNELITSFLKLDLKLFNVIEQDFVTAVDFYGLDREEKIKNYEIKEEITGVFKQ